MGRRGAWVAARVAWRAGARDLIGEEADHLLGELSVEDGGDLHRELVGGGQPVHARGDEALDRRGEVDLRIVDEQLTVVGDHLQGGRGRVRVQAKRLGIG